MKRLNLFIIFIAFLSCGKNGGGDSGPTYPQSNSIVAHYPLDGSGEVSDGQTIAADIGSSATAKNSNGAGMSFVEGKNGEAVQFDGSDDYVLLGDLDALEITGELTLSLWTKLDAFGNYGLVSYGASGETQATNQLYFFHTGASNTLIASHEYAGGSQPGGELFFCLTCERRVWAHIIFVRTNTFYRLYINGTQVGSDISYTTSPDGGTSAVGRIGPVRCLTNFWTALSMISLSGTRPSLRKKQNLYMSPMGNNYSSGKANRLWRQFAEQAQDYRRCLFHKLACGL